MEENLDICDPCLSELELKLVTTYDFNQISNYPELKRRTEFSRDAWKIAMKTNSIAFKKAILQDKHFYFEMHEIEKLVEEK